MDQDQLPLETGAEDARREPSGPARPRSQHLPLWFACIGAGLIASCVTGLVEELFVNSIPINVVYPAGYENMGGYQKNAVRAEAVAQAERIAERTKAALTFALLGFLLAILLSAAGGLLTGSPSRAFKGALVGGVAAAAAGIGLSWLAVPIFFRYQEPETSGLLSLFLVHAAIFTGIGAAVGLAVGLSLADRSCLVRAIFGGLLGALLGTFLFEVTSSLAFPLLRTDQPMPGERLPRLLLNVIVAVTTALVIGISAAPRRTAPPPVEAP